MTRLLDGPELSRGAESLAHHNHRLGLVPPRGREFIETLERSRLTGRGGAGFPVGAKWRTIAGHSRGRPVILVNGAEGEPQSRKDRLLMTTRPHLILDGAFTAARVLRARRVVLYIGEAHHDARTAMVNALAERPEAERRLTSLEAAPHRYVAGESSAAVHLVNERIATPTTTPPHPHQKGIDAAPTLVQNVETLAHVALIARSGAPSDTMLLTLAGAVTRQGVLEVDTKASIGEAITFAGGPSEAPRAILLGGYFGSWIDPRAGWDLSLGALREHGLSIGCGVIGLLAGSRCPVCETAAIMRYLAAESSAQCGPCFFGLRALAGACTRLAEEGTNPDDLHRLHRWAMDVRGRGACRHPDGAVIFLESALRVFEQEFANHPAHALSQSA